MIKVWNKETTKIEVIEEKDYNSKIHFHRNTRKPLDLEDKEKEVEEKEVEEKEDKEKEVEEVEEKEVDNKTELEMLKKEATEKGIQFAPNIWIVKLKEKLTTV